jgi:hypothetical protein
VLATFGRGLAIRKNRKPHKSKLKSIQLECLHGAAAPSTRQLGIVPTLLHRVNPLADKLASSREADTVQACAPFPYEERTLSPPPARLNADDFARATADYPDQRVRAFTLQAIRGEFQPFFGDLTKTVAAAPTRELRSEESIEQVLACMNKNVQKGITAGPFSKCPVRFARICPVVTTTKDEYDPMSTRRRLISMFDSNGSSSVNELCWSPWLLSRHLSASHLRDRVAAAPADTLMGTTDVKDAFKLIALNPKLQSLFVYLVHHKEKGPQYFVDLCMATVRLPTF